MRERSRTKSVYINTTVTIITYLLQIVLGFLIRKLFIKFLGLSYLGYNSVFSNILQMLNLADLGIGVAITSFLYKPLAEGDEKRIASLMHLYKKFYQIIGGMVLCIGLIISPFLTVIIPDATCSAAFLRLLFYINLAGTVSTYYLAYKRTLLIADQRSYVAAIVDTVSYFALSSLQIFGLLLYPNYILYLILVVGKNIISNLILSLIVNRKYSVISDKVDIEIVNEYKPQIVSYIKDVFVSRIGAYIYYGTDNLIISIFRGSLLAGFLSNYTLVANQVLTIVTQTLSSIQATFGNYISIRKNVEDQQRIADYFLCVNYCIGNVCLICMMYLVQPLISLILGEQYLLSITTSILLSVNLMLTIMLQLPSQLFTIYKLFKYDKPIIAISAGLNIVISAALVKPLGVDGVLIGTFITSLIYLFSRFYIVSTKVYKTSPLYYITKLVRYFAISTISVLIIFPFLGKVYSVTWITFPIETVLVGVYALSVTALLVSFGKEFNAVCDRFLPQRIRRYVGRRFLIVLSVIIIGIVIIFSNWGG